MLGNSLHSGAARAALKRNHINHSENSISSSQNCVHTRTLAATAPLFSGAGVGGAVGGVGGRSGGVGGAPSLTAPLSPAADRSGEGVQRSERRGNSRGKRIGEASAEGGGAPASFAKREKMQKEHCDKSCQVPGKLSAGARTAGLPVRQF
ncbi:hypothetical protein EVAR_14611_1 [Eumeta japonica]|uniref:Uncharacterized protein n=1 Tax=Eumeta variegata TaxID=151549 RepID=A0A4C1UVS7_EUMVA|nr:hypothetical protein EVAR_14611_1 [Eumeta japonica]